MAEAEEDAGQDPADDALGEERVLVHEGVVLQQVGVEYDVRAEVALERLGAAHVLMGRDEPGGLRVDEALEAER